MSKLGKRKCVFCSGKPVTREHAIPKWVATDEHFDEMGDVKKPIPRLQPRITPLGGKVLGFTVDVVPGPARDQVTVRVVCSTCNSGWMSDMEKAVVPYVKPLIRGKSALIPSEAILLLKRWALKTSYMFEFSDPRTRTVTQRQLDECFQGIDNYGVQVFVSKYSGKRNLRAAHSALFAIDRDTEVWTHERGGITSLIFGDVAFVIVTATSSQTLEDILMSYHNELIAMHPLGPINEELNLTKSIDSSHVDRLFGPPTTR